MNKIKNCKEHYEKQLSNPKWRDKRRKILDRDNNKCANCDSTNRLQVHHKVYRRKVIIGDVDKWDVNDADLITLCNDCHLEIHSLLYIPYLPFLEVNEENEEDLNFDFSDITLEDDDNNYDWVNLFEKELNTIT